MIPDQPASCGKLIHSRLCQESTANADATLPSWDIIDDPTVDCRMIDADVQRGNQGETEPSIKMRLGRGSGA